MGNERMTTIVAIKDVVTQHIVMAGDLRVSEPETGRYYDSNLVPKVAVRNDVIFGVAGDKRLVDHVVLGWEPPETQADPVLAMHYELYPSLLEHIGDMEGDWQMLVGCRGSIFYVDSKGIASDDGHLTAAVGSGAAYALGYLQHAHGWSNTRGVADMAIQVASEFDMNTSSEAYVTEVHYDSIY